jgi:hypothetical protein
MVEPTDTNQHTFSASYSLIQETQRGQSTETDQRSQGLSIILRRYGGNMQDRTLQASTSLSLPFSQRLRSMSSSRRPIEEDSPLNPIIRVDQGRRFSTTIVTRSGRERPSNPIRRIQTLSYGPTSERDWLLEERRSINGVNSGGNGR